MLYRGIGSGTFIFTIVLAVALMGVAAVVHPGVPLSGDAGICLPSPNLWDILPLWSRVINAAAIVAGATGMWFLNKKYNFVRHSDFILPSFMLIFTAANPMASGFLGTSTLLMLVNLLALGVLFDNYRVRRASQDVFIVATFYSIGSMADYTFFVMTPMVLIAALMLKCLRIKEGLAFIIGLALPYWIALGFGLITFADFRWPHLSNLFNGYMPPADLITMIGGVTLLWFSSVIVALNTAVKLYAGNPRPRTFNYIIYLMSVYCALAMVLDSANLTAYLGTIYMCSAVMMSNFFMLNTIPRTKVWIACFYACAIAFWAILLW